MKNTAITLVLLIFMFGCDTDKSSSEVIESGVSKDSLAGITKNYLKFDAVNTIVEIDSISDYVMYPLVISDQEESSLGGSFGSSYGSKSIYWNIIFYNTQTGEYHLLDEKKKMLIGSYNFGSLSSIESKYETDFRTNKGRDIYYTITVSDYNKDGNLDSKDPQYLFMSDNEGRNLKQISPNNMNVESWSIIEKTGKLLIQAKKDTDGDKLFGNKDEIIPYVFDLKTAKSIKEIFNLKFRNETQKIFEKQFFENK